MNKKITEVQKKIESLNGKLAKLEEKRLAARQELKDSLDEKQAERVRMIDAEMSDVQQILTAAKERERELIVEEQEAQRQAELKQLADMREKMEDVKDDILQDVRDLLKKMESLEELANSDDSLSRKHKKTGLSGQAEYPRVLGLYRDICRWRESLEYYHRVYPKRG